MSLDTYICPECKRAARLDYLPDGPPVMQGMRRDYQVMTLPHRKDCPVRPGSPRYIAAVEKLRRSLTR